MLSLFTLEPVYEIARQINVWSQYLDLFVISLRPLLNVCLFDTARASIAKWEKGYMYLARYSNPYAFYWNGVIRWVSMKQRHTYGQGRRMASINSSLDLVLNRFTWQGHPGRVDSCTEPLCPSQRCLEMYFWTVLLTSKNSSRYPQCINHIYAIVWWRKKIGHPISVP